MAQKKQWADMTKAEKVKGLIIFSGLLVVVIIVVMVAMSSSKNKDASAQALADKVNAQIEKLDDDTKSNLESTGVSSYRGTIMGAEPHSSDTVKVRVSTQFKDAGDGQEGGKGIARVIFNMICADVPELDSLYVESTSTGLQSKSAYRNESACK